MKTILTNATTVALQTAPRLREPELDRPAGWRVVLPLLLLQVLAATLPSQMQAQVNGVPRRPFYIVAHNPNTPLEARIALDAGANALEPDVTACTYGGLNPCDDGCCGLRVYHDEGDPTRPVQTIEEYCDSVNALAREYLGLALIVFDIKSSAATPAYGQKILNAIRNHLNTGGVNLNVILSVGTRGDGSAFDNILGSLGPREGVQIDAEDDAASVVSYFTSRGYSTNIAYGDGTAGPGPHLYTAMDYAAFNRAVHGLPRAITYVYALSDADSMKLFMDAGVDGIIPDIFPPPPFLEPGPIQTLRTVVNGRTDLRLATRDDNPFDPSQPATQAYALQIVTADEFNAGTDAKLTFTLTGSLGSSAWTVDTSVYPLEGPESRNVNRMEQADVNYVTIPSKDLGALQSITVYNDGSGTAPGWQVDTISVYSARWLGDACRTFYSTSPNYVIDGGSSATFSLTQQSGLMTADAVPGFNFYLMYSIICPGGTIRLAGGTYNNLSRIAKPCRLALLPGQTQNARFVHP